MGRESNGGPPRTTASFAKARSTASHALNVRTTAAVHQSATGCTLEYDCSEVFREREIGIDLYCYACTCIYDTTSHRPSVVLTSETSRQGA